MPGAPATDEARRAVVHVCRRLWERGLIAGQDGNVSVRLPSGRILVTPAGLSKVECEPGDLVELAPEGTGVWGGGGASSGVLMPPRISARRPDVMAVVHAHPPTATGFAVAGEKLMANVLPEIILGTGL